MLNDIDLRKLADLSGPERAFVSLYLSGPQAMSALDRRIRNVRVFVADHPDEVQHFDESIRTLREYLEEHPPESGGMCLFACWANDFLEAYPLPGVPVPDLLWVSGSPYIRPLAELKDEYENFVVVAADNTEARVIMVTSAVAETETEIEGNIKNHVKKGGWSQKRYQRRRSDQLMHYGKEIADALQELEQKEDFRRLLLVGSQETLIEIEKELPDSMRARLVGEKNIDLGKGEGYMWRKIYDLFFEEERESEAELFEQIKGEYLRGGLAAVGAEDVLAAAAIGRVEKLVVTRDAKITGVRCRDCENTTHEAVEQCPVCGSESVFKVDLVNEVVDLLASSNAEADFVDPIPALAELGHMAALLRY